LGNVPVGVAVAGRFTQGTGSVDAIAISSPERSAWFATDQLDSADESAVASWLADPGRRKFLHDLKHPLWGFTARGWTLSGLAVDTALAAYLVRPDQRSYDLAELTQRYLGHELKADDGVGGQLTLEGLGGEGDAARSLMLKAAATRELAMVLEAELAARG